MVTALLSSVEEDGAVRASAHVGIMLQARAFETSRRRDVLSFSHHREVALLSPADADRWLDWAEEPLRDRGKPTSSMGRLTLTVLLSFAQFRARGHGRAPSATRSPPRKKNGMWMSGVPPYRAQDRKLVIIDSEAEIVRSIFRRYAELGSVRLLKDELET